jgi:hypothetical protein
MMSRIIFLGCFFFSSIAWACDPCALYHAARLQGRTAGTGYFSLDNQHTSYSKTERGKTYSQKSGDLVETYSTTQISGGYDLSSRAGVQLTVPVIYRAAENFENYKSASESDTKLGDILLSSNYSLLTFESPKGAQFILGSSFGVKLPTGDTGTLESFSQEKQGRTAGVSDVTTSFQKHHPASTASGGRALTFGTGSVDYIFGLSFFGRMQRWLVMGATQYSLRTEGDFGYEYADDFIFDFGPGYYFYIQDEQTAALRLALTGEFKERDHVNGELVDGSGFSNLYLGPEILVNLETMLLRVGVDFRMSSDEAGATVMPDTRIRSGWTWRF